VASTIRDPHAGNKFVNGIIFTFYFKNFVLTYCQSNRIGNFALMSVGTGVPLTHSSFSGISFTTPIVSLEHKLLT